MSATSVREDLECFSSNKDSFEGSRAFVSLSRDQRGSSMFIRRVEAPPIVPNNSTCTQCFLVAQSGIDRLKLRNDATGVHGMREREFVVGSSEGGDSSRACNRRDAARRLPTTITEPLKPAGVICPTMYVCALSGQTGAGVSIGIHPVRITSPYLTRNSLIFCPHE